MSFGAILAKEWGSADAQVWLAHDGLFRFVKMLLQVGHEGGAAGADCCGIGRTGLMLAMDVTVGVADVDFSELGQKVNTGTVGGLQFRVPLLPVMNIPR